MQRDSSWDSSAAQTESLVQLLHLVTFCLSPPSITQEDWRVTKNEARFFLFFFCYPLHFFVMFTQMEFTIIGNQSTLFTLCTPKEGGKTLKNKASEAFSLPEKYKFVLILSLHFLKNPMRYSWVHTQKKHFLNRFICHLRATKDTFYFHISSIFSSKAFFVCGVSHVLANMSLRKLIWQWGLRKQE